MSKFFSKKYEHLVAYVPGEQPKDLQYVKLNTNESPYPPAPQVYSGVEAEIASLNLYSDPDSTRLSVALAELFAVKPSQLIVTNGSDEVLNFAFMAFSDCTHSIVFPDITYGFYSVFADLNNIPYEVIPLRDDLTIDVEQYVGVRKNIVIANPNAPTGIALPLSDIERIIASNPDNVVIIDEAYVDFGAESAIRLVDKYDNLVVVGTFSKSRSLAGARLGFAIASEPLISDLNTIKYSTNPYNVNRMTEAAGYYSVLNNDYYMDNCEKIKNTREYTTQQLKKMGFSCTDSRANFIFAKSDKIDGYELYIKLKARGVLIRHFSKDRIKDYNRITVGTRQQMDILLDKIAQILKEKENESV